jgi:hypothetical protein
MGRRYKKCKMNFGLPGGAGSGGMGVVAVSQCGHKSGRRLQNSLTFDVLKI